MRTDTGKAFFDTRESVNYDENGSRVIGLAQHGPPPPLGQAPHATTLWLTCDAKGNRLDADPTSRARLARIKRVNAQGLPAKERTHREMVRVVNDIGMRLGLTRNVRERAIHLGHKTGGLARGIQRTLVASTLLLLAARECGSALRPADFGVVTPSRVTPLQIARRYRTLNRKLDLRIRSGPAQFVSRLCSDVGLPHVVQAKAIELLQTVPPKQGKSPLTSAAGAVYTAALITGHRIGQHAIAEAADVSEVSLRAAMRVFAEHARSAEQLGRSAMPKASAEAEVSATRPCAGGHAATAS